MLFRSLFVTEDMSGMEDMETWNPEDEMTEEKPGFLSGFLEKYQQQLLPAALAVIAVLLIVIVVMFVKHRRAKAALEADEDEEE